MNLKPTLLAASLALATGALALTPAAFAADGTVNINGKVLGSTCTVGGTGGTTTVTLPDVQTSALSSSGVHTGDTGFTIALTDCPTTPSGVNVGLQFFSGQDTAAGAAANGQLANTGGATSVDVQLLDSSGNAVVIASAAPTDNSNVTDSTLIPTTSQVGPPVITAGSVNLQYTARYYATAAAGAGSVSATTQFVVNYQ